MLCRDRSRGGCDQEVIQVGELEDAQVGKDLKKRIVFGPRRGAETMYFCHAWRARPRVPTHSKVYSLGLSHH